MRRMANLITELWWLWKHGLDWRTDRRTFWHERLGELRYTGRRSRPGTQSIGIWKLQPPGFEEEIGVDFESFNNQPTPEGLALLERLLANVDALFARGAVQAASVYQQMVEEPMPTHWREAFRLDHISLPDAEEATPEWQVSYWCEAAQHWLVVDFRGEEVDNASFEG